MKLATLFGPPLMAAALLCAEPETAGPNPFANGERLHYEVVWPSGLSLGEADFVAQSSQAGWQFSAELSADLPTITIRDRYGAQTDEALCTQEFEKDAVHGPKKWLETVVFDQGEGRAERTTGGGGGESEMAIPPCARDGLTYLYYLRKDLAQGRIPPPDDVNFGAQYQITVSYVETRTIEVGGRHREADRILVDLSGPGSQHGFEVYFAKDDARTPLIIRVPFDLGTFSLKLVE